MFRFLNKWFTILWRPLLIGLFLGLLISNLVILKEQKRQSAERDEALRRAAMIQELIIEKINRNTDRNTEEIIKLQRLTACLLVAHDIDLPVNAQLREECAEDIMHGFSSPPQNQNVQPNEAPASGGSASPPSNGGENPEPPEPTPLLLPEGEGLIRDSVPILGRL